jgi:hypothetical protein
LLLAATLAVPEKFAIAVVTPSPGAPGAHDMTLRGEVVETACFVIAGRRGEAHKQCAIACARAGQNLGILDDSSKLLYVVVQDRTSGEAPNPLRDYIATTVEVKGVVHERGGIRGITVHGVRPLGGPGASPGAR